METLYTDRLVLCPITVNESAFIFELLNSPGWLEFIGDRGIKTLDDARNYILQKMIHGYEQHGVGLLLVKLKTNETAIGICGLIKRPGLDDIDIGFAFLPEFTGKGYAFEAASICVIDAFKTRKLNRIVAITIEANTHSRRLLEKIGLRFEKKFFMEGDPEELMLYSINHPENN